jgi:hypothetical protein
MTPDLKYREYVLNKLVSDLEGFVVYYNPQLKSWWWINPETKEWRFEFKDSGSLYWYYHWGDNFRMKYSLDDSEFEEMISRYVEHTLQNGVVNTRFAMFLIANSVEHTLQNGVVNTNSSSFKLIETVEHTLQNGVINTVEWYLTNKEWAEHTLQYGVVHTAHLCSPLGDRVEHTLQNGSIINQ